VVKRSKPNIRDNRNNVRRSDSKHFRNKEKEYLNDEIIELAAHSKNKNMIFLYRELNKFKYSYEPKSKLLNDEDGDLLAVTQHFE
jgi:hypothetical protein